MQHVVAFAVGVPHVVGDHRLAEGAARARVAVVGDVRHAEQPGHGRPADLELVDPRQQPVERVDELLHVQRGRGHLGQRDPSVQVEQAPDQQGRDDGDHVAELHRGEPHRAQAKGVALGRPGPRDVGVGALVPAALQAERLDGPRALHGLGEALGHVRVRGVLAQVAVPGPLEVPPGGEPDQGHREERGQHEQRPHQGQRAQHERARHHGDQRLRHGVPHRARQRVDVARGAGDQVARARALDGRQGQCEHAVDELLPQLGEHLLAELGGDVDRVPDEHGLHDDEAGDGQRDGVDADARALSHALDQLAQQAWPGETRDGGEAVQAQGRREPARVLQRQPPGVRPHLRLVGDRQDAPLVAARDRLAVAGGTFAGLTLVRTALARTVLGGSALA